MTVFAVTFENLVTVAIAASLAGIGVTGIFSLALLGTARSMEARREKRVAWGWSALAFICGAGVVFAAAAGIYAVAAT